MADMGSLRVSPPLHSLGCRAAECLPEWSAVVQVWPKGLELELEKLHS